MDREPAGTAGLQLCHYAVLNCNTHTALNSTYCNVQSSIIVCINTWNTCRSCSFIIYEKKLFHSAEGGIRSRLHLKSQSDIASKETWELLNALFNQELINRLGEKKSGMGVMHIERNIKNKNQFNFVEI